MAKYEESAGDQASIRDRITIYDQTDRFGLRGEHAPQTSTYLDEKPSSLHVKPVKSMPSPRMPISQHIPNSDSPEKPFSQRLQSQGPSKQIRINGITVQAGPASATTSQTRNDALYQ